MSRNTSNDDCNACDEYRQLSRREFVSRTTATAVALSVPAWLPRVTYAQTDEPTGTSSSRSSCEAVPTG